MDNQSSNSKLYWFLTGAKVLFTLPSLFLASAIVGFAGLAIEIGLSMPEVAFINFTIWALPAKMVMVASILSGASMITTFLAVTFSSIRFMPMVAALFPEVRQKTTPTWLLLLLSHFVAITAWVYTFEKIKQIPRDMRVTFFAGVGSTLTIFNTLLVIFAYPVIETFPPEALGALFFLTPIYFLFSLWRNARDYSVYIAMGFGLLLGPVLNPIFPQIDVLVAGFLGGTAATAIYYLIERRGRAQ